MRRILLTGATSAIAQEAARHFASDGDALVLAGRNLERLGNVADDLRARGASQVETIEIDFSDISDCPGLIEQARDLLDGLDVLLIAQGTLPVQTECERDVGQVLDALSLNTTSAIALLVPAANLFEQQGHGCLAVITSIAGVRVRRSNYVYGSAKAAVSAFLEGLRGRMTACGVSVVDVRPGFVDTPMTADMPKNPLFATAPDVGRRVYRAVCRGEDVVYTPWFWRWIALVIQCIPRPIFKRMNF